MRLKTKGKDVIGINVLPRKKKRNGVTGAPYTSGMRLICAYENKLFSVSRKQCPFLFKAERFSFWHSRLLLCNKLLFRKQQENPARKCDGLFA